MIKKSFILFIVLFATYNLICPSFSLNFLSPQGFWQENQIKAQDFIYSDIDSVESVIVGTSQSSRILVDSLPGFLNLAFYGESMFNGLYLLQQKKVYPDWVFIETNILPHDNIERNSFFYETLYNPVLYLLRRYFPAMRDGKQPILLLSSLIEKEIVDKSIAPIDRDKYAAIFQIFSEPSLDKPRYSIFKEGIDINSIGYSQLSQYVDSLKSHGTQVVFFEIPTHEVLCNSYNYETTRLGFEKKFPPTKYLYMPRVPCGEYKTLDGWHMGLKEAIKYTKRFRQETDSLKKIASGSYE